ncbi:MAG TPA: hypothetical protein VJB89_02040 [Candidatus Nanoarchaeia archaeon]|nr:hypothetical protein [Candidatus Nanoarchaeia archaeon]
MVNQKDLNALNGYIELLSAQQRDMTQLSIKLSKIKGIDKLMFIENLEEDKSSGKNLGRLLEIELNVFNEMYESYKDIAANKSSLVSLLRKTKLDKGKIIEHMFKEFFDYASGIKSLVKNLEKSISKQMDLFAKEDFEGLKEQSKYQTILISEAVRKIKNPVAIMANFQSLVIEKVPPEVVVDAKKIIKREGIISITDLNKKGQILTSSLRKETGATTLVSLLGIIGATGALGAIWVMVERDNNWLRIKEGTCNFASGIADLTTSGVLIIVVALILLVYAIRDMIVN